MLASILWVTLVVVLVAAYFFLLLSGQRQSTGSGGIGAVSGTIGVVSAIGILFGPPIVPVFTWWLQRRS